MAAPKGNQFWKARSSHGRNPIFSSPEELWEACVEYFEWVEENPLCEDKLFAYQGQVVRDTIHKMRAMTIGGLCIFLDIGTSTWSDYCAKDDFSAVTTRVDEVVRTQKFQGAAADLLNANIIARDLGLADKQDVTADVKQTHTISAEPMGDDEWEERYSGGVEATEGAAEGAD